jgi:hypothetical protein
MNQYPNFLIIGAMKCATSTLHEQLALQPGIFMSELKEPNFFSNDEQYAQGMSWYLSHFQSANDSKLRGESSTHYSKLPTYPKTVERIQQHLPDAKFIYVMRHPIKRLISQYIHEWSMGVISVDINRAISQYPELIDYSLYSTQLEPYFARFGRDRILPVFFERLLSQPQAELERICQFLGYQGNPVWQELQAQNVSSQRMRHSPWRDFLVEIPVLKEIRQNLIPKSWCTWVRSQWTMQQKPELTPENLMLLQEIFDRDLAIFGYWLGVGLSCANYATTVQANSLNWQTVVKQA